MAPTRQARRERILRDALRRAGRQADAQADFMKQRGFHNAEEDWRLAADYLYRLSRAQTMYLQDELPYVVDSS